MRRVFNVSVRGVAAVAVIFALAGSGLAAPAGGSARERGIAKIVKRLIRALGDGLIIPIPNPTPPNP